MIQFLFCIGALYHLECNVFRELGRGAFGEVWEGTAEDIMGPGTGTHRVAVKVCQDVCLYLHVFTCIYLIT